LLSDKELRKKYNCISKEAKLCAKKMTVTFDAQICKHVVVY